LEVLERLKGIAIRGKSLPPNVVEHHPVVFLVAEDCFDFEDVLFMVVHRTFSKTCIVAQKKRIR
jgi:hypothetical protein